MFEPYCVSPYSRDNLPKIGDIIMITDSVGHIFKHPSIYLGLDENGIYYDIYPLSGCNKFKVTSYRIAAFV